MNDRNVTPLAWTNPALSARFHAEMDVQARANFAKRLRELARYKGLNQEGLAYEAGLSVRNLTRLEKGETENPRKKTIDKLAKALGVPAEDLTGPRPTPEEMDHAAQTQLDRIEAMLRVLLEQIPKPDEEIDRLLQQALRRAAERDADTRRASKTRRRRDKGT